MRRDNAGPSAPKGRATLALPLAMAFTFWGMGCGVGQTSGEDGQSVDSERPLRAEQVAKIAAIAGDFLKPEKSTDRPGYIISIIDNEGALYTATSGAANLEYQQPVTEESVFHIASLSKQITAAALAHAVLDGKVRLDDQVSKWIPETKKYGSDLTVAHLVYMTSGLTEYYDVPRSSGQPWVTFDYFNVDEAIAASLSADKLRFQPGTAWAYSNINYMLLTEIVKKAYGKPFPDIVREKIFVPLGMVRARVHWDTTTVILNRADAYAPRTTETIDDLRTYADIDIGEGTGEASDPVGEPISDWTDNWVLIRRNAPHFGGSGIMTSMAEWRLWLQEGLTQEKLGAPFWAQMLARQTFQHPKDNDAFGLVHGTFEGRATLWYSGGDIDTSTYSVIYPDDGLAFACFANNPDTSCEAKTNDLIRVLIENDAF
ncbi:MAG: serine hydrolase domain-containing protein [Pseudomonadota bacterium]